MAGCRRSEIQMEVYNGLPIMRSPEGRRWLDAKDRKFRWRLQRITDYHESRRSKMAGCRRLEIHMVSYDGLRKI